VVALLCCEYQYSVGVPWKNASFPGFRADCQLQDWQTCVLPLDVTESSPRLRPTFSIKVVSCGYAQPGSEIPLLKQCSEKLKKSESVYSLFVFHGLATD
jgi:hypothetical protein